MRDGKEEKVPAHQHTRTDKRRNIKDSGLEMSPCCLRGAESASPRSGTTQISGGEDGNNNKFKKMLYWRVCSA